MNNKKIVMFGIFVGVLSIGSFVYAEELNEVINAYLQDNSFDFLGRGYDKMFFRLLEGENPTLINKIKAIPNDIKTLPKQMLVSKKVFNQNIESYTLLGGLSGLKSTIGAKEFNIMMKKILRLATKIKL
ncbi:hypothetical protein ACR77J_07935 [Tissierella praeacuta]|uniref:hypothetical protein n=1 Tax=Tissierella praeacuta TaxID=43131 RepID=UPI003DA5BF92